MTRLPEDIFNDALDLPPEQRRAFLDSACAGDAELRREVEALLQIACDDPGILEFTDPDRVPERIGRYRVLGLCGSGGMGTVYRAEDPTLGRVVALKVLASRPLPDRKASRWVQDARVLLEREARCLASLNHPNTATIHSLEYENGAPFLVMEFVEGETLARLLETKNLAPTERLRICREAACGIEAAHDQGIIHRDLKPANVMVTGDRSVKVLDFGIAKVVEISEMADASESNGRPAPGSVTTRAGTPGYMSPEQCRGESVDHRADIWAFGRLLCDSFDATRSESDSGPGRREGGGESAEETQQAPTVKLQGDGLPRIVRRRLERLANRCLQHDPENRPGSMQEVREELERIDVLHRRMQRLRRWGWLAPTAVAVAVLFLVFRGSGLRGAIPVSAEVAGRNIEVQYSNGETRFFSPPAWLGQDLNGALVVPAGPKTEQRMVIAWTGSGSAAASRLLAWESGGQLIRALQATDDWPSDTPGSLASDIYRRKRFGVILPPSETRPPLIALEYARYFPCVLRSFELSESSLTETYRLYHAGQISNVLYAPGLRPGTQWMWVIGRIRDGGILRAAANGVAQNTHFLACFPAAAEGVAIFPPWVEPDSTFLAGHADAVRPARPYLYFVLRGIDAKPDFVDWDRSTPTSIDDLFAREAGSVGVLLSTTVRIDLRREGPERVHVSASASGDLADIIDRRAEILGVRADSLLKRFLADSMIALASAQDGLTITGDFRDIRGDLPPPWEGER